MRKKIFLSALVPVLIALAWGVFFYQKNLRGISPVLKSPPKDIAEILDARNNPPENTTEMPLILPEGFSINIFAKNLIAPRVLALDPEGKLITSITSEGTVIMLPDANKDGKADTAAPILNKLNRPHGLAFRCDPKETCRLFVAESHQVASYIYNPKNQTVGDKKTIANLPNRGNHFSRTILFAPDGRLLVSVGSSCNVCHETEWRRAKILSVEPEGSELKEFARGLRNSVFMAIHPITKKILATEMGRDLIGDDLPPDEINIIEEGKNYGWPVCFGKNTHDSFFDKNTYIRNPCMEPFEIPSLIDIQAHSAPLGLAFIPSSWGPDYEGDLLVALHGSWNRSDPSGYKVVRYDLDRNGNIIDPQPKDFISGWLTTDGALGRPVDLLFNAAGTLFVSDDKAGVIYRISPPRSS